MADFVFGWIKTCTIIIQLNGRGERIRTSDILLPKQARYRAAPRPENLGICIPIAFQILRELDLGIRRAHVLKCTLRSSHHASAYQTL